MAGQARSWPVEVENDRPSSVTETVAPQHPLGGQVVRVGAGQQPPGAGGPGQLDELPQAAVAIPRPWAEGTTW